MKTNRRARKRGVTLIELMVAIGLTGTVFIAVSGIFLGIRKQWGYSVVRGKAVESAETVLDQIAVDARNGMSFQATDGAKTNTFTMPINTDAQGNYIPARVGQLIQYVAGKRLRYYLSDSTGTAGSGTMVWREQNNSPTGDSGWTADSAWSLTSGGSSSKTKYNNITSLTFTTSGQAANTVQVTVTATVSEQMLQTYTITMQRTIFLSNHN